MPAKPNPRNHRNNPYMLDGWPSQVHRSAAGTLWRFRTELAIVFIWGRLRRAGPPGAPDPGRYHPRRPGHALAALPWTRRFVIRRAWCVISRHRIQKMFFETRMHTRSGRLPLVLRIRPTEVGERAVIWCRAGICFEDFEAHTGELAAACYAREARIERRGGGRRSWPSRSCAATPSPPAPSSPRPGTRSVPQASDPSPPPDRAALTGCPRATSPARGLSPPCPWHQKPEGSDQP